MPESWLDPGFGLYVHWPFCAAKCPYCDFNSHVSGSVDQMRWANAYLSEIRRVADLTEGRRLSTIFFGGGTPSLMEPELVKAIVDTARSCWPTSNRLEITLEANPTSSEASRFRGYADAGVNRLSMGVQALNDEDLKALGRLHTVEEAIQAFDLARDSFPQVSFDLIYGRQRQTLSAWRTELLRALDLAVDHLSLYQLTIEDGTAFGARHREGKLPGLPDDDLSADMFELTQELTRSAGYLSYEVSNHARPDAEARHNLIYWRSGDYGGIGPGAHGRLTRDGVRIATDTPLVPDIWLKAVEDEATGQFGASPLSPEEALTEFLLMGLRLREGVLLKRLSQLDPTSSLAGPTSALEAEGLLARRGESLALTEKGRPLLNAVLRELLP